MTEAHKRANRHPNYKTAYRVNNWHEYDQALGGRGDLTLWLSQEAIDAWAPPMIFKIQTDIRRPIAGEAG